LVSDRKGGSITIALRSVAFDLHRNLNRAADPATGDNPAVRARDLIVASEKRTPPITAKLALFSIPEACVICRRFHSTTIAPLNSTADMPVNGHGIPDYEVTLLR
jgi:hypothetical protein